MFLRIGATAFGGLGTTLALTERELVTKRGVLTLAEVTEALTYTKLPPWLTGPQAIAYLGYKLGGWSGSALATAAFLGPLGPTNGAPGRRLWGDHRAAGHWAYALITVIALGLALLTKVHPLLILIGGVALGWVIGALMGPTMP